MFYIKLNVQFFFLRPKKLKGIKIIDEDQLVLSEKIGTGAFSDVYLGKLILKKPNREITVAIKVKFNDIVSIPLKLSYSYCFRN
jgi:hypothetical protein